MLVEADTAIGGLAAEQRGGRAVHCHEGEQREQAVQGRQAHFRSSVTGLHAAYPARPSRNFRVSRQLFPASVIASEVTLNFVPQAIVLAAIL
uniref:hypothetical protein n=1 Tax=Pseudomonas sp. RW407 TaxID=2202894 RepID=UPI0011B46B14|nr:hypothetical protein [Pseudomonas sp. RW407]